MNQKRLLTCFNALQLFLYSITLSAQQKTKPERVADQGIRQPLKEGVYS